jgi:hypothetical protein
MLSQFLRYVQNISDLMPESRSFTCAVNKIGQAVGWDAVLFAKGFLVNLQFG